MNTETLTACMQCQDRSSGQVGDFIHRGDKIAMSPVFDNWAELYHWMNQHGYILNEYVDGKHVPFRVTKN